MTNSDIIFTLPSGYTKYNNSYIGTEFDYSFYFHVYIQSNSETIKNFRLYKNGKLYTNAIINNTGPDSYYIKDLDIIKKGNCHYKVEVTLNSNKIYRNGFYLKIQEQYIPNDIKIIHFSTQGLHENFNHLNILLSIDTQYHIDHIKLYRNNTYLGEMEQGNYGYIFKDFPFDVTLSKQSQLEYKTKIVCSNGITREASMIVPIYLPTFSLNSINYLWKENDYTLYGGLVCKILSSLSEFNNWIMEFQIDTLNKYFKLKAKDYLFTSEKFSVKYPDVFIKNQTNANPNIYEISGEGIIHYKEKLDQARFYLRLINGNDYSCILQITPRHDESLTLTTSRTLNNIVRYYDEYMQVQEYDDKTISNIRYDGILFYDQLLDFYQLKSQQTQNLPIDILKNLFQSSNHITCNKSTFYFLSYTLEKIEITEFDGINTDVYPYKHTIYSPTLEYMKSHICFKFDRNDSFCFDIINYDTSKNLEIISIKDREMQTHVLNNYVSDIFDMMRIDVLTILKNGYEDITFNQAYLLKERTFKAMDYYNYTNDIYMFHFTYSITSDGNIIQYDYIVNFSKSFYNIERKYFTITTPSDVYSNDGYNQKPMDIMEHLNNAFYLRFSKSLRTKSDDDYGRYEECSLYQSNSLLYKFKPEDFYLEEFSYKDLYQAKAIKLDYYLYMFIQNQNTTLVGCFDLTNNTRLYRLKIPNKFSNQYVLSLNDEQLMQFSNILSIAKQNEFVPRTMNIFSYSDESNLHIIKDDIDMNQITPFHNIWENGNGFMYNYQIDYPLNIKNRNDFLEEIEIVASY